MYLYCFIYRIYKSLLFTSDNNKSRNTIQETTCASTLKFIMFWFFKALVGAHGKYPRLVMKHTKMYYTKIHEDVLHYLIKTKVKINSKV